MARVRFSTCVIIWYGSLWHGLVWYHFFTSFPCNAMQLKPPNLKEKKTKKYYWPRKHKIDTVKAHLKEWKKRKRREKKMRMKRKRKGKERK
ncbi:hypothetical protein L873DRAFT_699253 [Choiromyces venosus 120613-1]|uniref:Uncharacterized protein n=1 Tax=Choiromyces venosus 120613-1 TaxID=1336337 RepID=A0A3N4JW46_9PEZI|nr:hypothetical protein L873DRAFT_699253 [Choiromyces venosus 120613-1]